jgi:Insertion element 4 transposase N-terminal
MPAPVLAAAGRPACPVDLGVLTVEITPELVDEVIELSGCREKRQRLLPAVAVVPGYYLLFACTERNVPSTGVFMRVDLPA